MDLTGGFYHHYCKYPTSVANGNYILYSNWVTLVVHWSIRMLLVCYGSNNNTCVENLCNTRSAQ